MQFQSINGSLIGFGLLNWLSPSEKMPLVLSLGVESLQSS